MYNINCLVDKSCVHFTSLCAWWTAFRSISFINHTYSTYTNRKALLHITTHQTLEPQPRRTHPHTLFPPFHLYYICKRCLPINHHPHKHTCCLPSTRQLIYLPKNYFIAFTQRSAFVSEYSTMIQMAIDTNVILHTGSDQQRPTNSKKKWQPAETIHYRWPNNKSTHRGKSLCI